MTGQFWSVVSCQSSVVRFLAAYCFVFTAYSLLSSPDS
jgi:hypothetical protein